ncbi:hypothetical protein [Ideonella sp.]|uniref:acyltransferase n=1 Tax=Ideonella sp. TaxID=1929293 RepID=UPI0035B2E10E
MFDQPLLLEPLLRLMPLPPSLVRHAPLSNEKRLRSVLLRNTPQGSGLGAMFDDTCVLTVAEDMEPAQAPFKLTIHGGKKHFSGVHLTALSPKGQLNLTLGDDGIKVFVGVDTNVRVGMQLFRRPTVFIGDRATIGQSRIIVNHADLVIGEDCQLIEDVLIQCNDPHPIIDQISGELINGERRRTYLGRHVLVQRRAMLMPGVRIGDGAIVQPGALVVHDIPAHTMVGGAPATTLREQVGWERDFNKVGSSAPSRG